MTAHPIPQETFRRACARYATGIAIATAHGKDGVPHGLTVNSFTSVSAEPPLVLVCVDYRSTVIGAFRECAHYGINVLGEDQEDLSIRFATKGMDRFDTVSWNPGETGVPLIEGAIASFECRKIQTIEAGDHAIFIGEVEQLAVREGKPLLYFASGYHRMA